MPKLPTSSSNKVRVLAAANRAQVTSQKEDHKSALAAPPKRKPGRPRTRPQRDPKAVHADLVEPDEPEEPEEGIPPVPRDTAVPSDIDAAKLRACQGIRRFGTKVYACRFSGFGRTTLNRLLKDDLNFRRALHAAREEFYDALETAMSLRGFAPRGDLAGIFILKHRRKVFAEVQRVEVTGAAGGPIAYNDTVKAELLARLVALKGRTEGKQEIVVGERPHLLPTTPKIKKAAP